MFKTRGSVCTPSYNLANKSLREGRFFVTETMSQEAISKIGSPLNGIVMDTIVTHVLQNYL